VVAAAVVVVVVVVRVVMGVVTVNGVKRTGFAASFSKAGSVMRRQHLPGPSRPARPQRWRASAWLTGSALKGYVYIRNGRWAKEQPSHGLKVGSSLRQGTTPRAPGLPLEAQRSNASGREGQSSLLKGVKCDEDGGT